jgi:predicted GNAT family N-acyltransferase
VVELDERWRVEPLSKHHDRSTFSCGVDSLDRYLQTQASQDQRKRVAATFVLCVEQRVVGYYSLSALSVDVGTWPEAIARKLPRYPHIPTTLLGRLAVDRSLRGEGVGEHLLMDALRRALVASRDVGSVAVVVDAIDETAVSFYRRYGFQPFADEPRKLFLPMALIEDLFS